MENMDKGLKVPKWVLINRPKIPQMPQNLSAQIVCPCLKVPDFNEKRLHWASVVRVYSPYITYNKMFYCCNLDTSHFKKTGINYINTFEPLLRYYSMNSLKLITCNFHALIAVHISKEFLAHKLKCLLN